MEALILNVFWMLVICYLNYTLIWNIMILWNMKHRKIKNVENTIWPKIILSL